MNTPFHVPTVDITPYVENHSAASKAEVARQIDEACRRVGFMQIVGHQIPDDVIQGLGAALDAFFGMELEAKKAFIRPPHENRGYTPPRSESLSYTIGVDPVARMNDFFEAYNLGSSVTDYPGVELIEEHYAPNTWPEIPGATESFRTWIEAYYDNARRVSQLLVVSFADALGVGAGYFEPIVDHSLDVLRMNNYALDPGELELGADLTGMGEHTDFGIVTVLWADQVEGLQVLGTDGGWHDVMPADGALLVNLGDIAARLTNDEWMSTLHRVKPPVINGTIKRRRSAAFFFDGNAEALIETIPSFLADGQPQRYEPVTVSQNTKAKLAGSRIGIKNLAATAEAARVAAATS
ncbi:MAG TPA: 2-oxoglutarate and iron-dependent oxygenase domain-containing protein [Solirubrobacteraceae bacterium]|nr:2-oxoglutarate and iron-dependent oxygenase domain-containing protein [Solirubrobacteraceae bacterium]